MTNVIGPISQNDWCTMRFLGEDVRWMKNRNQDGKWNAALEEEGKGYRDLLQKVRKVA